VRDGKYRQLPHQQRGGGFRRRHAAHRDGDAAVHYRIGEREHRSERERIHAGLATISTPKNPASNGGSKRAGPARSLSQITDSSADHSGAEKLMRWRRERHSG